MRAFPVIRDLVTDVSFNYEKAKELPSFAPPPRDADGKRRMAQVDVERGQEFRKCIECFLCQNTCHVVRDHEDNKPAFAGPRFFLRYAELDMHPLDTHDRRELAQGAAGLGMCNITKCCTEVCPEGIKITDNAIIPMKERVVDRKYDPLVWLGNKIGIRNKDNDGAPRSDAHERRRSARAAYWARGRATSDGASAWSAGSCDTEHRRPVLAVSDLRVRHRGAWTGDRTRCWEPAEQLRRGAAARTTVTHGVVRERLRARPTTSSARAGGRYVGRARSNQVGRGRGSAGRARRPPASRDDLGPRRCWRSLLRTWRRRAGHP